MTIQQALERLKAAEVQRLPLSSLKTNEALQPRDGRLVPFRQQLRTERDSEEHTGIMRLALEAALAVQLEPVLVAEIKGSLFIVDGHHRLRAYQLAKRETIHARVLPMSHHEAVLVSKLVNLGARALKMHCEQRRDAGWQYLAEVTHRGARGLPAGESIRSVAGQFGMGKSTVELMLQMLPRVNPKNYEGHLDPGTGWPRWRVVRRGPDGWTQDAEEMDMEQVTQHRAEMLAKKIGALIDSDTPEVVRRALEMLKIEEQLAANDEDARAFTVETADEDADY